MADLSWSCAHHTWLQGLDYSCGDPLSSTRDNFHKKSPWCRSAKQTGYICNALASIKQKNLDKTKLRDDNWAKTVYLPFCVETTGGIGDSANIVLCELAKVAFPGDGEDPVVRKSRNVWKSHVIKEHAFDLVRRREHIMYRKHNMIAQVLRDQKRRGVGGVHARHASGAHGMRSCRSSHDADMRARWARSNRGGGG